jgi:hypothetical protein
VIPPFGRCNGAPRLRSAWSSAGRGSRTAGTGGGEGESRDRARAHLVGRIVGDLAIQFRVVLSVLGSLNAERLTVSC